MPKYLGYGGISLPLVYKLFFYRICRHQYVNMQDCKMYIVLRFKGYRVTTGNFFIEVITTFDLSGLLMNMLFQTKYSVTSGIHRKISYFGILYSISYKLSFTKRNQPERIFCVLRLQFRITMLLLQSMHLTRVCFIVLCYLIYFFFQ